MPATAIRLGAKVPSACALCLSLQAAVLEGVVLDNSTGRPLARARVSLEAIQGASVGPISSSLSDSGGRFAFRSLSGGAYLLTARRPGYAAAKYGQKRWNASGSPIVLDSGGRFFAELRLQRLGAITGQVLDENHLGLGGLAVFAYEAGPESLRLAAAATTDDRGVYRISGLEPGRYLVRTGSRELEDGRGLLPTFFGQAVAAAEARAVEVALDREVTGIDIEPIAGRLGQLKGRIAGGLPASVTLYSDTGKREARVSAGGVFQFDELAPGAYWLAAQSSAEPPRAALVTLRVGGSPSEITLQLAPLPRLHVRCEEVAGRPIDARTVSVFLRRKEPPEPGVIRLQGGETAALPPGTYEAAAVAPPQFYIASMKMPGAGSRLNEFQAMPAEVLELTLLVSSLPALIRGRVVGPDGQSVPGAPVFLNPVDPELRARLEGGRNTRSDQKGEFRFYGLPPGRYQIFSSFEIAEPTESDWASLPAASITVEEKEEASLELKLIGAM